MTTVAELCLTTAPPPARRARGSALGRIWWLGIVGAIALTTAPVAQADLVDVTGGFTQYFGPLEKPAGSLDRQTYFSIPGAYSFAASPNAAYADLPIAWENGVGNGSAGFVAGLGETRPQIDFYIGNASGSTTLLRNAVSFTPAKGADVGAGDVFKLGSFTFTNGAWLGGFPDSLFQMNLRTVSANPALDGHMLGTYLGLHVTDGLSPDGSRYSPDPVDNADYFYLTSSPFFGGTEKIGYVGVYEADPELLPPGGSNTGSIDLYGQIGSLIPIGFANPQGVKLRSAIPVVDGLPPAIPEPGTWALLLAGLATLWVAAHPSAGGRRKAIARQGA